MSKKTLSGSIALTKLKHVRMNGKGKGGKVIPGIFIPIEANKLIEGKPAEDGSIAVYIPIRVLYNEEQDKNGQNGFIAKSVSTDEYKAAKTDAEKEALKEYQPILGNVKEFTQNSNTQDSAGAASSDVFDPDDDLPF